MNNQLECEKDPGNILKIIGWILLLILGIVLIVCSFVSFVSAAFSCNDFTSKWNYCGLMNISGIDCDHFWQNASDCNQNITIVNNATTFNESNFYTKEQIDTMNFSSLFSNFSDANLNNAIFNAYLRASNGSSNATFLYITREQFDNATMTLKNNLMDNFVQVDQFNRTIEDLRYGTYSTARTTTSDFNPIWILIAVIGVGAGALVFQSRGKFRNRSAGGLQQQIRSTNSDAEKLAELTTEMHKIVNKGGNLQRQQPQQQQIQQPMTQEQLDQQMFQQWKQQQQNKGGNGQIVSDYK